MKNESATLSIKCDPCGYIQNYHGDRHRDLRHRVRKYGWKIGKDGKDDLCPDCHTKWKKARIESRRKKMESDG